MALHACPEDDVAWVDAEWAQALEEAGEQLAEADPLSAAAAAEDERAALQGLRKLAPGHVKAVLLTRRSSSNIHTSIGALA